MRSNRKNDTKVVPIDPLNTQYDPLNTQYDPLNTQYDQQGGTPNIDQIAELVLAKLEGSIKASIISALEPVTPVLVPVPTVDAKADVKTEAQKSKLTLKEINALLDSVDDPWDDAPPAQDDSLAHTTAVIKEAIKDQVDEYGRLKDPGNVKDLLEQDEVDNLLKGGLDDDYEPVTPDVSAIATSTLHDPEVPIEEGSKDWAQMLSEMQKAEKAVSGDEVIEEIIIEPIEDAEEKDTEILIDFAVEEEQAISAIENETIRQAIQLFVALGQSVDFTGENPYKDQLAFTIAFNILRDSGLRSIRFKPKSTEAVESIEVVESSPVVEEIEPTPEVMATITEEVPTPIASSPLHNRCNEVEVLAATFSNSNATGLDLEKRALRWLSLSYLTRMRSKESYSDMDLMQLSSIMDQFNLINEQQMLINKTLSGLISVFDPPAEERGI